MRRSTLNMADIPPRTMARRPKFGDQEPGETGSDKGPGAVGEAECEADRRRQAGPFEEDNGVVRKRSWIQWYPKNASSLPQSR